jgi:hypothetical protein
MKHLHGDGRFERNARQSEDHLKEEGGNHSLSQSANVCRGPQVGRQASDQQQIKSYRDRDQRMREALSLEEVRLGRKPASDGLGRRLDGKERIAQGGDGARDAQADREK